MVIVVIVVSNNRQQRWRTRIATVESGRQAGRQSHRARPLLRIGNHSIHLRLHHTRIFVGDEFSEIILHRKVYQIIGTLATRGNLQVRSAVVGDDVLPGLGVDGVTKIRLDLVREDFESRGLYTIQTVKTITPDDETSR